MSLTFLRSASRALSRAAAAAAPVAARRMATVPTAKFGAPDSDPYPTYTGDSSSAEGLLPAAAATEGAAAPAAAPAPGDGSDFFTDSDLRALGLGAAPVSASDATIAEIAAALKHFPVPSFPASTKIEIHPVLLQKLRPVCDRYATPQQAMTLMLAAAACRDAAASAAILAHARAASIPLTLGVFTLALDTAVYRTDRALFDAALAHYDARFGRADRRHGEIESARVAFLQRAGDADAAFAAYSAAVAAGVLKKPWRPVYAKTLRRLTPRLAVSDHTLTTAKADRVRADAVVLHEPHPEANFAAWRYAVRALRGDLDLSFPGADIRVPENLVIDIATAGVRMDFRRAPGARDQLRRRRNLMLGYIKATGRQMPVSIRSKSSLFYVPKAEVERVVTSDRFFLPAERKQLAENAAAAAAAAAARA